MSAIRFWVCKELAELLVLIVFHVFLIVLIVISERRNK